MAAAFQGFQSLVENSPAAISLINEHGEILYGSPSHTDLLGYQPDELVGRDCREFVHPEDRDHCGTLLREVIETAPGPLRWDVRVRRKDGNYRWVESTISNLTNDQKVQALVMHQRDIDDRIAAQEKSRKQAEELIRSNLRMEEFAYTVAHDLREPLRAISLYTKMLFARVTLDAGAQEMANFVIEGASRMTRMVADLLSFAQTGMHGTSLPVDLNYAVALALENLALEIKESGAVVTVDGLPTLDSNETHLVSLFQNLISNAIKYRSGRPLRIQVSGEHDGTAWVFRVKDNGVGIASQYLEKIFVPFVRLAHHDVPGTGLGLAVCKKVVDALGGTIRVESELGAGSTFAFSIPDNTGEADCAGLAERV